ncbi:PEP-CTERM system TPR-repeat protein PrsT [Mitsuaria sp. CC2]|uniref:XrtA/PEP-CTERM system TPR-repeat protein PrsT n=1 Tax=Mitsuaria sp. CC2 TaxID=3029186 RepID=UPI003B8D377B
MSRKPENTKMSGPLSVTLGAEDACQPRRECSDRSDRSGPRALRRGATALALGSALLLAGCFGDSAQDLVKSAKGHLEKRDNKAAIIQLKNALQKDETLAEARFLLAKALLDSGDVPGAVIEADKAKTQGFGGDALVALQARLLLLQGKVDELLGQYGSTHLRTPADEADLQMALVGAYVAKQKLPEARQAANAALRAAPDNPAAGLVNVRLLSSEGKPAEALAEVERVIAKSPQSGEAWQLKGELQVLSDAPSADAVASFRKAVELDKKLVGAHAGLINVLMRTGDKAGAKEAVAAMKAAAPQHPQTFYYAAVFAMDAGQVKEATDLTQALLKAAPNNDRALFLAGRVAQANGDFRQAETQYSKIIQASPETQPARVALAQLQLRGGDPDQAMATLQPALDAKSTSSEALALAAEIRLKQGQGAEAERYLARAAEANPNDMRSRVGLALNQIMKGEEAAGLRALRQLAAEDKGTIADIALISVLARKKDSDGATQAIAALEKKDPKSSTPAELRGRLALLRGDRAGARAHFEEAARRDPGSMTAANSLAAQDLQERKVADAVKRYEAVLKADPKNLRAEMAVLGLKLTHQLIDKDVAAKRLTELAKQHPDDATPRQAAVGLLMEKKDLKAALALAQEGVTASPDNPALVDLLGQVQAAAGDRQQAISSFNKVATLQPRSPLGPLRLADAYAQAGDKAAATAALKRAQAIAPGDGELARKVVEKSLQLGLPDLALTTAKALQTAQPKFGLGWKLEGDVARARKDAPAAIAAYRKADQLAGDAGAVVPNTELAIALHGVLIQSGKKDEADRWAASYLARVKTDELFAYHLGDVALNAGRYPEAEQRYQAVLTANPDNAAAANNVAWLRLRAGKADEGLKFAEQANKLRPNVPPYMDTLAEALAAKGQTAKAIEVQKDAVKQAPNVPAYRLRLAQLYVAGGNKGEAEAELKRLADLGPNDEQQAEVRKLQAAIR